MNVNIKHMAACLLLLAISHTVLADSDLAKLEQDCEQAREKKIAPLRTEAIKECANKDKSSRDAQEKCERFYVDFGAATHFKSGGHKKRMFNDLPECLKLYDAERKNSIGTER